MSPRTWLATDFYAVLGVNPDASADDIARAFRAAAKRHHPDRAATPAQRSDRFSELTTAYAVLGDREARAHYDAVRAGTATDTAVRIATPTATGATARVPVDDSDRPLSVRALPTLGAARWAVIGGVVLVVGGVAIAALVAWLVSSGTRSTSPGSDTAGRDITLALVALKLVVVGVAFWALGRRRARYP